MKKKLDLISLSKDELSSKQKARVLGGNKPGFLGCCCSGDGMSSGWAGVRKFQHQSLQ